MKRILTLAAGVIAACGAFAEPLTPTITGHDINFGAWNMDGPPEWATNGVAPDTLIYVPGTPHTEATAYWPAWPAPPVMPIFNAAGAFGGDFVLGVAFTGQDAPYVGGGATLDVSLTGTGLFSGPDLLIFGAIPAAGIPFGLLWALDLEKVSLYGYSNFRAYVLEGVGTIVDGEIARRNNLIGQSGVMRGHLDFPDWPADWIPALYDPLKDPRQAEYRAAYSGETGKGFAAPEPGTMLALVAGAAGLLARRRRNK